MGLIPIISHEHGSITIDCENQFKAIKSIKSELIDNFIDSEKKICFGYYIGVDWLIEKEKAIYIEPKINGESVETDYLKMLFDSLRHPGITPKDTVDLFDIKWDAPQIEITRQQDLLTPLLVIQFLRVVQEIVRKGLKKSYYRVEQNLYSKVKGKILVGQNVKQNLLKNKTLNTYCTFDEFGINGLENRLLKKALVFVHRYLPTLNILNSKKYTTEVYNYIMPAFEFVSEEVNLNEIKHSKTNAFYKEYADGIRLAKLILKRFGYSISNTQQSTIFTPPFWIDMSKLFELYVLGLLKEKYGTEVKFQFQANYGQLDYLLTEQKIIVDAKYKTYYNEDFTGQDQWKRDKIATDIRQLSGYARMKSVYKTLAIDEKSIIDCLIIYPDQKDGYENLNLIDLKKFEIKEFVQFFKLPVKLPVNYKI